jgi:hypothetical protein
MLVQPLDILKETSYLERTTNSEGEFKFRGAQLSFKHNFPKAGREWTADATYNKRTNINENLIKTDKYDYPANNLIAQTIQQQNTSGTGQSIIVQTDFVNPLTDKSK